ncbi:MAG: hypothetical protein RID53_00215 [Coleofasciculus sp. B1-GNL1-01]|uniref:hypothetical protein n=1 Tax=Coleofasciculus sp. B1-GNL1-01 TaxID=3068484 RepID=UPI0032F8455C
MQSILSANGYHFFFLSRLSHSSAQIVSQLLEKSHRTQGYWDWSQFGHHKAIALKEVTSGEPNTDYLVQEGRNN